MEPLTLRDRLSRVPQIGRVTWIAVRPGHGVPMELRARAELLADRGIVGDRAAKRGGGKRQVTLIQAEHLEVIARLLGRQGAIGTPECSAAKGPHGSGRSTRTGGPFAAEPIDPALLRRNVVVEGLNLEALKRMRFTIGGVLLEGTGPCEPCGKMDEALGDGGFHAMRGHGGITARVIEGGEIAIGDEVRALTYVG
jgi:MOSC domain-containing protein YiiM